MATRTPRVFSDVISVFYVYTDVDNREKASVNDLQQRRRISWEEKYENVVAASKERQFPS